MIPSHHMLTPYTRPWGPFRSSSCNRFLDLGLGTHHTPQTPSKASTRSSTPRSTPSMLCVDLHRTPCPLPLALVSRVPCRAVAPHSIPFHSTQPRATPRPPRPRPRPRAARARPPCRPFAAEVCSAAPPRPAHAVPNHYFPSALNAPAVSSPLASARKPLASTGTGMWSLYPGYSIPLHGHAARFPTCNASRPTPPHPDGTPAASPAAASANSPKLPFQPTSANSMPRPNREPPSFNMA
jgi:hypothetical protein